jgi:hypothetical protein
MVQSHGDAMIYVKVIDPASRWHGEVLPVFRVIWGPAPMIITEVGPWWTWQVRQVDVP